MIGSVPGTNATAETVVLVDASDFKGRQAPQPSTGRWDAASMIQVVDLNLLAYLTLGIAMSTATYLGKAVSANVVADFMQLCFLGGFIADSFLCHVTVTAITIFSGIKALTLLMLAAMHDKINCQLLQAGANTTLMLTAMYGKIDCELLQDGANAIAEGTSPKPPTGKRGLRQAQRDDLAVASRIIMASAAAFRSLALILVIVAISVTGASAGSNKYLNITNHCSYTVWPGILSVSAASSAAAMDSTGFELVPGEWRAMPVPSAWSGRVWGRTHCSTDAGTGKFTCVTGDCGSGKQDCAGGGPALTATVTQFTLDGSAGMDWYGVSLVDGFNLPVLVAPQGAAPGGNCAPTGCVVDLNAACPAELRVTATGTVACKSACLAYGSPKDCCTGAVACKSACMAFGSPEYCCTGEYGTPSTCKPSSYSELFKKACPRAYIYEYDGGGSTFNCAAGGDTHYSITFCPITTTRGNSPTSTSRSSEPPMRNEKQPQINGGSTMTTPYTGSGGVGGQVGGEKTASGPYYGIVFGAAVLSFMAAVLALIKVFCSAQ